MKKLLSNKLLRLISITAVLVLAVSAMRCGSEQSFDSTSSSNVYSVEPRKIDSEPETQVFHVSALQSMAERTGGEYYFASDSSDLINRLSEICGDMLYHIDFSDYDNDGLPDVFERSGMRLSNGRIICTDPYNSDTDGDGILDGQEVAALSLGSGINITIPNWNVFILPNGAFYIGSGEYRNSDVFFNFISYPDQNDSDNDDLLDFEDPDPCHYNNYIRYSKEKVLEYCEKYYSEENPNSMQYHVFSADCANFVSQCIHAGGIPMNDEWYYKWAGIIIPEWLNPKDNKEAFLGDELSYTWTNAYLHYKYFKNNDDVKNGDEIVFSSKEEMQEAFVNDTYSIQPGDLLYMQWENDDFPSHAVIIDGYKYDYKTWSYSGHTAFVHNGNLITRFWNQNPHGKLYVIRIKDVILTDG